MKIVFDLDYTLLDTVKFKEALVAATGVDEKAYEEAYADAVARNGGLFEPGVLFAELKGRGLLTEEGAADARARFDEVLTTTERYLYPHAKELVEALGKHEADIDLMTFGNADWQRAKVEHSGLARMFDAVLYAEKDKKEFVRGVGEGQDKVIIVNDNGKEMQEMMSAAPEYSYILKKGPKAVPADLRLPTAQTIDELVVLLERETGWEIGKEMDEAMRENREGKVLREGESAKGELDMGEPKEGEDPSAYRGVRR
ncbi:MAG TPA: HAD hydrolase-like protein [Patescibacteria group bacterium]|nr:HAD hydrolase-like protein [Patescibacteria group bacterium]